MGDEPYTAFLPWIVFAVIARSHGDGVAWAAVCAVVTAGALLLSARRPTSGPSNVLMRAAIPMFTTIGVLGFVFDNPSGWMARNGRVVSALGFTVIALGSLAYTPVAEFYTRPRVRPRGWNTRAFDQMNVTLTLIWAGTFVLVAVSHLIAAWLRTPTAFTTFNWVVPLAIAVVALHRSRECFENFVENDEEDQQYDRLWDLSLEWDKREF